MNPYSLLYIKPDFIPQHIISIILQNKSEDYSKATSGYNNAINDYRKTKWLNLPENIGNELYKTIYLIHEQELKHFYKSELDYVEPPQFLRYDVGDGYKIHNDCEDIINGKLKRIVKRDISILLYLNNEFDGGELEFAQLQLKIKPKAGMLIAFPSYFNFEHIVHPVTKGTRYAISSWIATKKRLYARPYDGDPEDQ